MSEIKFQNIPNGGLVPASAFDPNFMNRISDCFGIPYDQLAERRSSSENQLRQVEMIAARAEQRAKAEIRLIFLEATTRLIARMIDRLFTTPPRPHTSDMQTMLDDIAEAEVNLKELSP